MQVVKEFPYLKVIWDAETRGLISQWYGGFKGRNLREGLEAALEEYKKRLPNAQWIGDTTDIGIIGLEDQKWIDSDWFPRLLATGIKFMAVVQPKDVVAQWAVKAIVAKVPGTQLTTYSCGTLEEARAWLKEQAF